MVSPAHLSLSRRCFFAVWGEHILYLFGDSVDENQYWNFDKRMIETKQWAALPKAAKSVFVVIASFADEKGKAFPGEEAISNLSGYSEKIVRGAIHELVSARCMTFEFRRTKRGRRSKEFTVNLPKYERGNTFPFFIFIVHSGIWRLLKPSALSLYPVMRHFSYFEDEEGIGGDEDDFRDAFLNRDYDLCEAEISIMAEHAGVNRCRMYDALRDLRRRILIEPHDEKRWKVFLRSKENQIYTREYLNSQILKSKTHKMRSDDDDEKN